MKSVAMAFYNGAKYIDEQIRSILDNMEETDELIISVDDASDGSEAILEDWVQNDQRIRIIKGPGKGVVKNFENAFKRELCTIWMILTQLLFIPSVVDCNYKRNKNIWNG